jgi:hypothetical protein
MLSLPLPRRGLARAAGMTDLERLREEAEQEMRRKAPRCERSDRAPSPPTPPPPAPPNAR